MYRESRRRDFDRHVLTVSEMWSASHDELALGKQDGRELEMENVHERQRFDRKAGASKQSVTIRQSLGLKRRRAGGQEEGT